MLPRYNHRSIATLSIAVAAQGRGRGGRGRARGSPLRARSQERQRRPRDRRRRQGRGRRGRDPARAPPRRRDPGRGGRRPRRHRRPPLVDRRHRRHGRVRRRARRAGAAPSCSRTRDGPAGHRRLRPGADELHAAARGAGASQRRPSRFAKRRTLAEAHVAVFLRQDRLVKPGVREIAHRLLDASRPAPPRRPGLARARLGRRRPPRRLDPARHRPVGLAPRARCWSPRRAARRASSSAQTRWHIAGSSALVDELVALLT